MQDVADFIVIGAGSAGCVLAARLSEDPRNRVLLIEAGGDDRPSRNFRHFSSTINIHLPAGFTTVMNDQRVGWGYMGGPEPFADDRKFALSRGKILGGSSSINGMTYIRGLPSDYDAWRDAGCTGWGYEDLLPWFRKSERQMRGADQFHGDSGPMPVSDAPFEHPVARLARQAFVEAGVPATGDVNGAPYEGVTFAQACIYRGKRQSMAVTHLHPALKRPNLRVVKNAFVTGLKLDSKRAVGVSYVQGGQYLTASAAGEIILAAGAIGSPHLLQLSGIGPGALLSGNGIPVAADIAGVGMNLQDHFAAMMMARLKPGTSSFNAASRGIGLVMEALRWAVYRGGLLAAGASQLTAFAKSIPGLALPDMQYFSSPATVDLAGSAAAGRMVMEQAPGLTIGGYPMRPKSRGRIALTSPDPYMHPSILCNYLSDPHDQKTTLAGFRLARRIFAQPALAPILDGPVRPDANMMDDAEVIAFARATGNTGYHQCGTCRMGIGEDAVVGPDLRVRNIAGLRVADASIMPGISSGNTNATIVAIAEKAAAMILADAKR